MSGKCRPSLRPKTLYNVDRSSLSTTDKECIHAVFELADHQKSEIEKNEKIIKAANDLIETQKAEIKRLNTALDMAMKFHSEAADERDSANAAIEKLEKQLHKRAIQEALDALDTARACIDCLEAVEEKVGEG